MKYNLYIQPLIDNNIQEIILKRLNDIKTRDNKHSLIIFICKNSPFIIEEVIDKTLVNKDFYHYIISCLNNKKPNRLNSYYKYNQKLKKSAKMLLSRIKELIPEDTNIKYILIPDKV